MQHIIAGNASNTSEVDISGTVGSSGNNLIGNTVGSSGWIGSDLLNQNPLLAPLGNNGGLTLTHAFLPGSPAINAGNNNLAIDPLTNISLSEDQRGLDYGRAIGGGSGGIVDIGAYEQDLTPSLVTIGGRVTTSTGRGIGNARVTLTDFSTGTIIYSQTNPFGYYRFLNLSPGTTYTLTVTHKFYSINSPQVVTIDRNRNDLNFIAR